MLGRKKVKKKEDSERESVVKELDSESFESLLRSSENFVVDCWNAHCAPCRRVHPMIEEMAVKFEGRITFGKLNTDNYVETAVKYGVMSVPTILVFKNGRKKGSITHIGKKEELEREILSLLEVEK